MTDKEILLDLLSHLKRMVHFTLSDLPPEVLYWQPDDEANNIAITVWHVSRSFDVFKVRLFEHRAATDELWHLRGWVTQTGYDPQGIGWGGYGNLVNYTQEEVKAVPLLSRDQLLRYFDQVREAMYDYIMQLSAARLYQQQPDGGSTVYERLRNLLSDSFGHVGEINAIKAMWERK